MIGYWEANTSVVQNFDKKSKFRSPINKKRKSMALKILVQYWRTETLYFVPKQKEVNKNSKVAKVKKKQKKAPKVECFVHAYRKV